MPTPISTGLLLTLSLSVAPAPLTSALLRAPASKCSDGKLITADSAGHCCWAGQVWSSSRSTCVGVPTQCPTGKKLEGETCATVCEPGKTVGVDTAGQCCWPAQVWSGSRKTCVGIPQCPAGLQVAGEQCAPVCPAGQLASAETGGKCCWPAQAWSTTRSTCVGIPRCPAGLVASGETCAAPAAVQDPFALPLPPPPPLPTAAPPPAATVQREQPAPVAPAPEPSPAPAAAEPPSDPLAVLPLPPPPPLPAEVETADAETKRVFLPLSPENDSAWRLQADILFDATQQRLGVRARFDFPFSTGKSSFALGGGLGILSPKFTSPSDSVLVFPLEAFASYRVGFADGRVQLIPRVGPVLAVLVERGNFSAVLKGSVGAAFRFSLGQPGNRRGLIAAADVLFPIAGAGWVFLLSFGTTL